MSLLHGRGIRVGLSVVDTFKAAMRRLLCLLTGHKPGKPTVVMGMSVRSCVRCHGTL
jgi:hypothetical protein